MFRRHYSAVVSTLALVVALTGAGAYAAGVLPNSVGPNQLRQGAVLSSKIRDGNVNASDIATGAVRSRAIASRGVGATKLEDASVKTRTLAAGAVTMDAMTMPHPASVTDTTPTTGLFGTDYSLLGTIGSYDKQVDDSVLQVDWSGTVGADGGSDCIFQLRVDGQPAGPEAGSVFAQNSTASSISTSIQVPGLSAGTHSIEVWARVTNNGTTFPCTISPATTGIGQTVNVAEIAG